MIEIPRSFEENDQLKSFIALSLLPSATLRPFSLKALRYEGTYDGYRPSISRSIPRFPEIDHRRRVKSRQKHITRRNFCDCSSDREAAPGSERKSSSSSSPHPIRYEAGRTPPVVRRALGFFSKCEELKGRLGFLFHCVCAPSSSGRAGASLWIQCLTNCSEVEVGLYV